MKRKLSIVSYVLLIALLSGAIFMLNGCKKEEKEIPWWEDGENWEVIIEDERSEEKSQTFGRYQTERIEFNYTYDETEKEEYIPKVRILYKGIEQEIYTFIYKREAFAKYPEGVDYDHPLFVNVIKSWGNYRVSLYLYLSEEDFVRSTTNSIAEKYIYINVNKGE